MAWKLATEAFGVTFPDAYTTIAQITDCPLTRTATVVFATFATEQQCNDFKAGLGAKVLADKTVTLTGEAYTAFTSRKAMKLMKTDVYEATADEFKGAEKV